MVRTPAGRVEIDLDGKRAGRGAYFCPHQECWDLGLRKGRLEHTLKVEFLPEDRAMLQEYARGLPHLGTEGRVV